MQFLTCLNLLSDNRLGGSKPQAAHGYVYCLNAPYWVLSATGKLFASRSTHVNSACHKMSTGFPRVMRGTESNGKLPHNTDCTQKMGSLILLRQKKVRQTPMMGMLLSEGLIPNMAELTIG